MLLRILLLAVAAVVVSYGIASAQRVDQCDDAVRTALAWKTPSPDARQTADRVMDHCTDARQRTLVVAALVRLKNLDLAETMARRMTREQPDDYRGWVLRESIASIQGSDQVRALYARAVALNPRGVPPLPKDTPPAKP